MTITTEVAIHLALNPERRVTSRDVAALCGVSPNIVAKSLSYATMKGWFEMEMQQNPLFPERKKICVWRAGPRLLRQLERAKTLPPPTLG